MGSNNHSFDFVIVGGVPNPHLLLAWKQFNNFFKAVLRDVSWPIVLQPQHPNPQSCSLKSVVSQMMNSTAPHFSDFSMPSCVLISTRGIPRFLKLVLTGKNFLTLEERALVDLRWAISWCGREAHRLILTAGLSWLEVMIGLGRM